MSQRIVISKNTQTCGKYINQKYKVCLWSNSLADHLVFNNQTTLLTKYVGPIGFPRNRSPVIVNYIHFVTLNFFFFRFRDHKIVSSRIKIEAVSTCIHTCLKTSIDGYVGKMFLIVFVIIFFIIVLHKVVMEIRKLFLISKDGASD